MNYALAIEREDKIITLMEGNIQSQNLPLTVRELEVLKLKSHGLSDNEIAERLFISIETVKSHRKKMLQKTDAKNIVELVRIAMANGWI